MKSRDESQETQSRRVALVMSSMGDMWIPCGQVREDRKEGDRMGRIEVSKVQRKNGRKSKQNERNTVLRMLRIPCVHRDQDQGSTSRGARSAQI